MIKHPFQRGVKGKGGKHTLYNCWSIMKRATSKEGSKVKLCKEWEKFEGFLLWGIKNNYKNGMEFHRINKTKDYTPENCIFK